MCGLAGWFAREGRPPDEATLRAMVEALAHRGPDGRGFWIDGPMALGSTRLAILDPTDKARLPFVDAPTGAALAYNGEVYNHPELRAALEAEGERFSSSGDTETVLRALLRWGVPEAVRRFDGIFAFALFEPRKGTLWLARDRMGVKPLAAAFLGKALFFASETKALLAVPGMPVRPDALALAGIVARLGIPDERPLLEGIGRVGPGEIWRVTAEAVERIRHFDLLLALDGAAIAAAEGRAPREVAEDFAGAFGRSVRSQMRSDAPVAATCSGGVDSGLVAAIARRENPSLAAYVADTGPSGEAERAEAVARALGVRLTRVPFGREENLRGWAGAIWHEEQPDLIASLGALRAVARACRRDGHKVLLSGEGSDELFAGYPWYAGTWLHWHRRLFRARFRRGGRAAELARLERTGFGLFWDVKDATTRNRILSMLDAEGSARRAAAYDRLRALPRPEDRVLLAHAIEDSSCRLQALLLRNDRMGMAESVEIRVPFLGNEVVDFALRLPARFKLRRGETKWVVKEAARRHLPRRLVALPKRGFPIPPSLHAGSERILRGGSLAGLYGWSARAAAAVEARAVADPMFRHLIVSCELWLRIFAGGERPDALAERLLK